MDKNTDQGKERNTARNAETDRDLQPEQAAAATDTALRPLLHLLYCALHGTVPSREILDSCREEEIFRLAQKNGVAALAGTAMMRLERSGAGSAGGSENSGDSDGSAGGTGSQEISVKWLQAVQKALRRSAMFGAERERLLAMFEERGIWYLPLKGVLLQDLYPLPGAREMSDNDILFDGSRREEVRALMRAEGYTLKVENAGGVDAWYKEPLYNFELHVQPLDRACLGDHPDYYDDLGDRVVPSDEASGKKWERRFRQEDFYIHFILHSFKHFSNSGTGLRMLTDEYLLVTRGIDRSFRWAYVEEELAKLDAAAYERDFRALALKLFSEESLGEAAEAAGRDPAEASGGGPAGNAGSAHVDPEGFDEQEQALLEEFSAQGIYGNQKNRILHRYQKMSEGQPGGRFLRFRYYLGRIFPPTDYMKRAFPILEKHVWLLPAMWVWRCIRTVLFYRKRIAGEMRMAKELEQDIKEQTGQEEQEMREARGQGRKGDQA